MIYNIIEKDLSRLMYNACLKAFNESYTDLIKIDKTKIVEHGDYSCNVAMILAKRLNRSPEILANEIIKYIECDDIIEKVEYRSPGFINFILKKGYFIKSFKYISNSSNKYFNPDIGAKEKVVIEYSQPNIAKPLGVHHLLSTIIGQSLVKIYEYINFDVIKINHIGDWGTQFGKLIYAYKEWGDKDVIEKSPIQELLKLYVLFHEKVENDESLNHMARIEFKKLEDGDLDNISLWKWIREISLKEVKSTYKKLKGITFTDEDYIGESFYNDKMDEILNLGKEKGVFYLSDGAYIADTGDIDPPLLVQKSDGTTLYATRDLAQVKYRSSLGISKNIMVVDVAQSLHFRQFFHVARVLGLNKFDEKEVELIHVVFGRMNLPDKNMSTRKGNVILLDDLIDESIERAFNLINNVNHDLSVEEKKNIAEISGLGAIKYNVLSQNRINNMTFRWDKMITLEGNSAPYLQYTFARAKSILRKNDMEISDIYDYESLIEKELIIKLLQFPDILNLSYESNMPHHIATYTYELCTKFNTFYNSIPVNKSEGEIRNFRIKLVIEISEIIKTCLNLLVIEAPEKM